MKLIIAGSRNFSNYEFLEKETIQFIKELVAKFRIQKEDLEIVSGTANGADRLGEQFAEKFKLKIHRYPACWDDWKDKPLHEIKVNQYGKRYWSKAGLYRNAQMAKNSSALLAFWDMSSPGTEHMIREAKKHGLEVKVVRYD